MVSKELTLAPDHDQAEKTPQDHQHVVPAAVPEDDVETMINTMVQNRFRHLPVLDKGKLIGLVSMGDLVKSQLKEKKVENRHLKEYIANRYPA